MQHRYGFVAILGAPNAGKSTLVNALAGEKVSIVTHKVQTTRFQIRAIVMVKTESVHSQLVLIDTPGIFTLSGQGRLGRSMVHAAWMGAQDADIIAHMVDAPAFLRQQARTQPTDTQQIIARLRHQRKSSGQPVFLLLNKIDLLARPQLLALIAEFDDLQIYDRTFLISALTQDGIEDLREALAACIPEGEFMYPPDQLSDMPARLWSAELTREQLFLRLNKELPYALTVETESWQTRKNGVLEIRQLIYVRRESQKAIILGRNGQTIKSVGQKARQIIRVHLDRQVDLFLFVKVRKNWPDRRTHYQASGLKFDV